MKKIITMLFLCVSSLGYGADFQDPYEYDFDTDLPLSALTGQDQPSDGAVLALPVSIDFFEGLPSGQIDGGNVYFCGDPDCFACFSTIEDRTDHEMRAHGQGYSQAPGFRFFEQDGNGEMTMAQDVLDFQQPVIVPEPAPVERSIDVQPGQTICHLCNHDCKFDVLLKAHMRLGNCERLSAEESFQRSMDIQPGQTLCHVCDKDFPSNSHLKIHMRTHTGEKPFVCKECGKAFTLSQHLKGHSRTHTGERPYVCSYEGCGKAFTQSQHLKGHMRVHSREKPYACSYEGCGKAFTRSQNLKTHMKEIHRLNSVNLQQPVVVPAAATFGSLSSK